MNITLIGMPGSGKSYIGKKLAEKIGYEFLELDSVTEGVYNLPLQKILDNLGDETFLDIQGKEAISHTENRDKLIISPGGSIVYTKYAMDHLKMISKIIYLETTLEKIKERIGETTRGIVGIKNKTIEELYKERVLLYKQYSLFSINADQDSETIINIILKILPSFS